MARMKLLASVVTPDEFVLINRKIQLLNNLYEFNPDGSFRDYRKSIERRVVGQQRQMMEVLD